MRTYSKSSIKKTRQPTTHIKQSGSSGFAAFRPASGFVTGDTDAATKSASFHIRDRYLQSKKSLPKRDIFINVKT
jgi:hypothetical protein